MDGLVVPDRFPPEVVGTPDFIAPECVATSHLSKTDPQRALPSIFTDRHALAVMVYSLLLLRHPLRGQKVHAEDPGEDERLTMGEKALFIEHPNDASNRLAPTENTKPTELPWKDPKKLPYTVTGPYLKELFDRAFIDGLHEPRQRPSADEWETALVKTVDLIQPCQNSSCQQGWFVFDNTTAPRCPFCGTRYQGKLPVINLYSARGDRFRPDNHRLMVYSNQSVFPWHIDRTIVPNERLASENKSRVGYFVLHQQRWFLVNESMPDLKNAKTGEAISIGGKVELEDGLQLLTGKSPSSRLFYLQMV
jgi:DNA-binding helix-hairpin-helix protein with protein kinase domain